MASTRPNAPASEESLRERKKRRTRRALVDTALERFTRAGYDQVTLDEVCAAAEVSKRTFFRYFASKEELAAAPLQDLWEEFLRVLEERGPDGRPLVEMARDAILEAAEHVADPEWTHAARLSLGLAGSTPAISAHNLQFCERTTVRALAVLGVGDHGDPRSRLALDMAASAARHALDGWAAEPGTPTVPDLLARYRRAFDALPGGLTVSAPER
ncbi:TetR family transcriptional regulator [Nocardiopsis dassonvillei]|uniref:TetR family transcriptional regulator n=1 Tax=Nocardiopsis dassonvillei TaxID=2014 RepID=UPI00200CD784|nr:TetR family transcriptional regulator [Nocardiopsis dassonvillei]MCK9873209.1 TetR family transcriptional regulator [Nocardiopsis dassonvillei]